MARYIQTKSYVIDAEDICFDCEEIYIDNASFQGFPSSVAIKLCPKHRPTKYSKEQFKKQFKKDWGDLIRKEMEKWATASPNVAKGQDE